MKENKFLKVAQEVRALKNLQKQLALEGDHKGAAKLGGKIAPYLEKVAMGYLGMSTIPQTPAGRIVTEIAAEAVFADPNRLHRSFIEALRMAMNSSTERNLTALREAKSELPSLAKARRKLAHLNRAKRITNQTRRHRARKRR